MPEFNKDPANVAGSGKKPKSPGIPKWVKILFVLIVVSGIVSAVV